MNLQHQKRLRHRKTIYGCWGRDRRKGQLGSLGWDGHVHTAISKMDNNKDLLYSTGNSAQGYVAAWMGGSVGENADMSLYG